MRVVWFLAGLGLLLAVSALASATTTPPPSGDWTVGASETAVLEGGSTVFQGNITVSGTLFVGNGSLELGLPACSSPATVWVLNGGFLRLESATINATSPCSFVIRAEPGSRVDVVGSELDGVGVLSTSQVSGVGVLLRGATGAIDGLVVASAEGGIGVQENASLTASNLSMTVHQRALYASSGSVVSLSNFNAGGDLAGTDYLLIIEGSTMTMDGGSLSTAPVAILTLSATATFNGVQLGTVGDVGAITLSSNIVWHGGQLVTHSRAGFESYGSSLDIQTQFYNVTMGVVLTESSLRMSNSTFNSSGANPKGSFAVVYARNSDAHIVDSTFSGSYWVSNVWRMVDGNLTLVSVFACATSAVWSVFSQVAVERTDTECFATHYEMEDSELAGQDLSMVNGTNGVVMLRGTVLVSNLTGSLFLGPASSLLTVFQANGSVSGVDSTANTIAVELTDSPVRVEGLVYRSPGLGVRVVSGSPTINGSTFLAHNETAVEVQGGNPTISNSTFLLTATTRNATGVFVEGGSPTIESSTFVGTGPLVLTFGVWAWKDSSPVVRDSYFAGLERAAVMFSIGFRLEGNTVEDCLRGFLSEAESAGVIEGNTFQNMTTNGAGNSVEIFNSSALVVGNVFANVNYGVQVLQITDSVPGETRISGNRFSGVSWYAIQALNSTRAVIVDNNSVSAAARGAVEVFRASVVGSYNLFFDSEGYGYKVQETNLSVVGDRLENLSRAIEAIGSTLKVDFATFSRDAIAIFAQGTSTSIHNSSFQSNALAIEFANGAYNEVHDSLFLSNGDSILAFNSAVVDVLDTNFVRSVGYIIDCEQNASGNVTFTHRGEMSDGIVKLRGWLTSDAPSLRLSNLRFQFQPVVGGIPGAVIRGAADLSMDALDFTNSSVRYSFVVEDSAGTMSNSNFVAPYPETSGHAGAPHFERSNVTIHNLDIQQAQGPLTFVDSVASVANLTMRNSNATSISLRGGSLSLTDAVVLDGRGCGLLASAGAVVTGTNATIRGHPDGSICADNATASFYLSDLAGAPLALTLNGTSDVGLWSTLVTGDWQVNNQSRLTRGWRVSATVALSNPVLLTSVAVAVADSQGHRTTSYPNATGSVNDLPYFPEWQETASSREAFDPYTVSATLDPLSDSQSIALDHDTLVQLVLDDTIPPTLAILAPTEGQIFNKSQILLSFTASDSGTGIRAITYRFGAGTPVELGAGAANFSLLRDLVDGTHMLTVWAQDFGGNEAEVSVNFTVDTIRPLISVTSPRIQPFQTKGTSVLVQVGFDADVVSVMIGGEPALIYRSSANRTIDVPEGKTVVPVQATDRAGNTGWTNVTIFADRTPPPLLIANRNESAVTVESFIVLRGTSEPGALVFVQGVPVQTDNGSFEALVDLSVGDNTIDVRARDALGNENVTSLTISRGVTEPSHVLDIALSLVGVALLLGGVFLLVRTMRSEYQNTEVDRRKRRFERGGRP